MGKEEYCPMNKTKDKYDFSGWATKNNILCSDGRTIRKDAFKEADGQIVPLVWNHDHNEANNVLGHAILENRPEGVYAYCSLNNTEQGNNARELIKHGDITSLSIYANQLKQNGGDVVHGVIREVSLVLAGANSGAKIETVMMHGDTEEDDGIVIMNGTDEGIDISSTAIQNDSSNESVEENHDDVSHSDEPDSDKSTENKKPTTVQEIIDSMNEDQKKVLYALVELAGREVTEQATEEQESEVAFMKKLTEEMNNEKDQNKNKEENTMKHNVFEGTNEKDNETTELTHDEFTAINDEAKRTGSLKNAFLSHGITDISNFYPEAQNVGTVPYTVNNNVAWVKSVISGVHRTPFSRVKSMYANITADEARAKGYVKGKQKVEEVFAAFKRTTSPTTIYKLQKLDRDDVVDITDFDVIAYVKDEMTSKLQEELARAILIGDGREKGTDSKIDEDCIRPILGDNSAYSVSKILEKGASETDDEFAKKFIKEVVKSRKDYKGSGNPKLYTTEDMLTNMLLLEDTTGHRLYNTEAELATALRVSGIETVEPMANQVRKSGEDSYSCLGIIVNLADYNLGASKNGQTTMFDDFDLNYNKQEYLIETRCSGALVRPYSAITFEVKKA